MDYKTILVNRIDGGITITINRPDQQNSINPDLLKEINHVLDLAENDSQCKIIVLQGQRGVFCTGMDFNEVSDKYDNNSYEQAYKYREGKEQSHSRPYLETIKRFTLIPKVVISVVDGKVMAGGVGLAAASDIVIATPRSQFSLSEALWGLLPSMVTPFLIRRVGFQVAYRMTLTTMPINAKEAYECHLVDEVDEAPQEVLRRYFLRVSKLDEWTLGNLKQYFRKMWIISNQMEDTAVAETDRLSSEPKVVNNIVNFIKYQKFPWSE